MNDKTISRVSFVAVEQHRHYNGALNSRIFGSKEKPVLLVNRGAYGIDERTSARDDREKEDGISLGIVWQKRFQLPVL